MKPPVDGYLLVLALAALPAVGHFAGGLLAEDVRRLAAGNGEL